MQVGDAEKTLSTTAETVNGVALSKDTTGVTAKMTKGNYMMTVFFDGSTAQIHIKGTKSQILEEFMKEQTVWENMF